MFYKAKDIFTLAMFKFHEPKLLLKAKISSWTKISLKSFTKYCIVFISGVKKCIDPLMGTNLFRTACIMWPNTTKGTWCLLLRKLRLSNRWINKLFNDTKFINIEVILLKIQVLQSVNFLLFSLYFTHCFAHYLRINLADIMSLLLYWVTYTWCMQILYQILYQKIFESTEH